MQKKIKCPFCGYSMPIRYSGNAHSAGLVVKCKGRNCRKEFEVRVEKGDQIR